MQNIVCHLENPDKMYKIINVKDIQTCNNSMSVCVPRNQAVEVLSICTSMRTTTVPLIVPGRLQSSMQQCRQQGNLRCVWPWQLHLQKDGRSGNMYRTQERSGFCQWQWSVSDIDSQTVTKSMSSLKTTMKDRLVIVMRYICTYYDAYSFEKKKTVSLHPCESRNYPDDHPHECVGRHCNAVRVSRDVVDSINHEAMMKYFNMSFGELCEKFLSSASANDPPICSKLTTTSESSGIGVDCRTLHPANCFGKLLPLCQCQCQP